MNIDDIIMYPPGCTRTDVLILTNHQQTPGWWDTRASFVIDVLAAAGIPGCAAGIPQDSRNHIESLIDRLSPRVVIERALVLNPTEIEVLARRYPQTRFVSTCHSSYAFIISDHKVTQNLPLHLALTASLPNVYFALVDERNDLGRLLDSDKCLYLPNVVKQLPCDTPVAQTTVSSDHPSTLSMIFVPRELKNLPTQLIGAALAAKQRPLKLLVSLRGNPPAWLSPWCAMLGLNWEWSAWGEWPDYMRMLRDRVDIGLQVSFTESFNYVGLEHLLCGKPVVGSPALKYLPADWQVNPDSPEAIAAAIVEQLDNYAECSEQAIAIGHEVAERQNRQFISQIRMLLN